MPERKIDPKFNIHSSYRKLNIVNPYRYGTPPPTGDPIQAETTAYMNAIGVPNDSTATIYGKTGAEVWQLFNSCIMIAKNSGKLSDIYSWHPMFGDNVEQLKYNALDTSILYKEFFGSWVFNEMGNQTNGSNTYATVISFSPVRSMLLEDCGFTVASNTNIPVNSSENRVSLGCRGGNGGFLSLSVNRNSNVGARATIGVTSPDVKANVSTAEGISTVSRFSGTLKLTRNQTLLDQVNISGGILPNTPIYYGAYLNAVSPMYYEKQRLLSECIHRGDDATVSIVHQMIDMWEAGLNRKTW